MVILCPERIATGLKCMRSFILLLLAACGIGLPACRRYAPVERHFLRVPAVYAGELSGIDREKWLKRSRKLPGSKKVAMEENYVKLPVEACPKGIAAFEGEVKFFPQEQGTRQGMVALQWLSSTALPDGGGRLWLLKTEGGRYVPQPLTRWLPTGPGPRRYSLSAIPGAIAEYQRGTGPHSATWRRTRILHWSSGQWVRE